MKVRFHNPYNPNDGHGPGVPLPDNVHGYLANLDGQEGDLNVVMDNICKRFPGAWAVNRNDYIGISHRPTANQFPIHHWMAIQFSPIPPEKRE